MKTQTSIRIEKEYFQQAKEILKNLGLTYSEAVNIFTAMIVRHKGLPFEVKIPNETTQKAIKEARKGKNVENISLDEFKRINNAKS
jgi:DNA-damage-inducible protein J